MGSKWFVTLLSSVMLCSCGQSEIASSNPMSISSEDHAEIINLISEYAYTFDEDRIEEFVDLFTEDAETYLYLAGSDTPIVKTSSSAERLTEVQAGRSGPINQLGMPRHFQSNTILKRISANRVSGRTMVLATQQPYDGTEARILFSGVYEDEFVLSDGRWRFALRRGLLDASSLPGVESN